MIRLSKETFVGLMVTCLFTIVALCWTMDRTDRRERDWHNSHIVGENFNLREHVKSLQWTLRESQREDSITIDSLRNALFWLQYQEKRRELMQILFEPRSRQKSEHHASCAPPWAKRFSTDKTKRQDSGSCGAPCRCDQTETTDGVRVFTSKQSEKVLAHKRRGERFPTTGTYPPWQSHIYRLPPCTACGKPSNDHCHMQPLHTFKGLDTASADAYGGKWMYNDTTFRTSEFGDTFLYRMCNPPQE